MIDTTNHTDQRADPAGGRGARRATAAGIATSIIAIAMLAIVPLWLTGYTTFQLTMMIAYAMALLGIVVLTGYCGQISLGQGAFFGIGAYVAAILIDKGGVSYMLALPLAGLASFIFGALFSLPALRLKGLYLALATFALAIALPQLLKHPVLEPLTGGVMGIALVAPDAPAFIPVGSEHWVYLIGLFSLAFVFLIALNLLNSRVGRAFIAIRDNSNAAIAMGVDLAYYKAIAFGVSALFTGYAGALSALAVQYVAPDSFPMFLSITLLVGAVVGGVNSVWAVIFGAAFIQFLPNIADRVSTQAPWMIYGLALIAIVLFLPDGIAGLLRTLRNRLLPTMRTASPGSINPEPTSKKVTS